MNKKGISMVALVITIIVLIILTGAVVMTGLNAPNNASVAVENYNTTVVQDAVMIYIMNEIADSALADTPVYKDVSTIISEDIANTNGTFKISEAELGLSGIDLDDYTINITNGIVTHVEAPAENP